MKTTSNDPIAFALEALSKVLPADSLSDNRLRLAISALKSAQTQQSDPLLEWKFRRCEHMIGIRGPQALPGECSERVGALMNRTDNPSVFDMLARLADMQSTSKDKDSETGSMGIPVSCGKPLCSPNNHHHLCKLAEQDTAPIDGPDYEALEREHFGDFEKKTGIYAERQPASQFIEQTLIDQQINNGLALHGLNSNSPSPVVDAFRWGAKWAGTHEFRLSQTPQMGL